MAITVLGRDESASGTWQIDYDDVGLTVGLTCTRGTASKLLLTLTEVDRTTGLPTGFVFGPVDVSSDFGLGRVVVRSNVPNSAIPPHIKGQIYPYTFSGQWS